MTIQEVITKAIKGGWKPQNQKTGEILASANGIPLHLSEILLDPSFWVCLFGEKDAIIKAKEFIDCLFNGETAENFFSKLPPMRGDKKVEI